MMDEKVKFEDLCKEHPDLFQEMADEKCILDRDKIEICLKHGVKFEKEFLEELGILKSGKIEH
ncbi:MAG: hypothetical protein ACE5HH_04420 [Candidatus Hydrothermarchaeales archaeon]